MKTILCSKIIILCIINILYISEVLAQNNTLASNSLANLPSEEIKVRNTILNGNIQDVQSLLAEGFDVNKDYGCSSMLNKAIQSIIQNENPNTPLQESVDKIKLLIQAGADVNMENCKMTPLAIAVTLPAQMRKLEIRYAKIIDEQILYSSGDCNINGISKPCNKTTLEDRMQMKKEMHSISLDEQKKLMPYAIQIIDILLENGAYIDKRSNGVAPIHFAANTPKDGFLDILKHLINKGANVNITDFQGSTPLFVANFAGNKEAIDILIKAGADVTIRNNTGLLYNQFRTGEIYNTLLR